MEEYQAEKLILESIRKSPELLHVSELVRAAGNHDSARLALQRLVLTGEVVLTHDWRARLKC
jgi:hypothetical protein